MNQSIASSRSSDVKDDEFAVRPTPSLLCRVSPKIAFLLVSFSLGELGDGLNIFQGIYLVGIGWNEGNVGLALSLMGLTALVVQPWAGDWVDKTTFDRRGFLVVASILTALSASAILIVREGNTDHMLIFVTKIIEGIAASFIGPCLAALTLAVRTMSSLDSCTLDLNPTSRLSNDDCFSFSRLLVRIIMTRSWHRTFFGDMSVQSQPQSSLERFLTFFIQTSSIAFSSLAPPPCWLVSLFSIYQKVTLLWDVDSLEKWRWTNKVGWRGSNPMKPLSQQRIMWMKMSLRNHLHIGRSSRISRASFFVLLDSSFSKYVSGVALDAGLAS